MTLQRAEAIARLLAGSAGSDGLAMLRTQGIDDEHGLARLLDHVGDLLHDDLDAAERLTDLCATAADIHDLLGIGARARYLQARLRAERGDLPVALELIDSARRGWLRAGQPLAALRTELGRMQLLDDLGRHAEAVLVGEALLAELKRQPATRPGDAELASWLRAAATENLGVALGMTGQYERSLHEYTTAERLYRALGRPQDTARIQANRGFSLLELGHPREALDILTTAVDGFRITGDRLWTAKCMGDIAKAYQLLGDVVAALRVLESSRATLDEQGAAAESARIRLVISEANLSVGLFSEARAAAEDALQRTSAAGMDPDTAIAHFLMALAHLGVGDPDRAANELSVAGTLFAEIGNDQYRARVLLAEAEVATTRGDREQAIRSATAAIKAMTAGGWRIPLAWATLRMAEFAGPDDADGYLDRAGVMIDDLRLPPLRHPYRVQLARRHRHRGRDGPAERCLRDAISDIERLGHRLTDHTLRIAFRADKHSPYDELVQLLVDRGRPQDLVAACRASDSAKAKTLVDLVTGTIGWRGHRNGDGDELAAARADLSAVYGQLLVADHQDRRAALLSRAAELQNTVSTLHLRKTLSRPDRPSSTPERGVEPGLPTRPTIAYHVIGDDVIGFVVRNGEVTARRLPDAAASAATQLDTLSAQWSRFRIGGDFARRHACRLLGTTTDILLQLYDLLIAPLQDAIDPADGQLTVVPHRRLHQVPFHALYDGDRFLAELVAVTVAPTMPHDDVITGSPPDDRPALLLAVSDAAAPSVEAEADAIASVMPGARVLLGAEATASALRVALPGPAVLHIACHGLFRPSNPLFSALRLADRWVTSAEIVDFDLAGALVTLSACESGRHDGEAAEPVGLAWAFLAAGARAVIASQWVVQDDVTADMMTRFYRRLRTGDTPAEAIRQAQLATACDHPHPFHWAPFSHVTAPAATGLSPRSNR